MASHFRVRLFSGLGVLLLGAMPLGGCVESIPTAELGSDGLRAARGHNAAGSPRQATVAITNLEGAPQPVSSRFGQVFAKAAAQREITVADASTAHYLVRGYLNATPADTGSGTAVTYVYDIFDANDQARVDRVTDTLTVPNSAPDAWAVVDDETMASLAGHSADRLAAALAATPVALASAPKPGTSAPGIPNSMN